jgi:hypothetical protein
MTRKQVAQRLGKSVATVRRLEGNLLHPSTDAAGRVRFDETEVESLVAQLDRGEVTLWREMRCAPAPLMEASPSCPRCAELEMELSERSGDAEERAKLLRRELDAVRGELDQERERYRVEQRHLERELNVSWLTSRRYRAEESHESGN